MRGAAVKVSLGQLKLLRWAIRAGKGDFRDLLMYADEREYQSHHRVECEPAPGVPNPEEEAFLAAIAKRPADNLTRLVYADWLEERDDPRAAYLRCLCEWLAGTKQVDTVLIGREEALRVGLGKAWLARIRGMPVRDKAKT